MRPEALIEYFPFFSAAAEAQSPSVSQQAVDLSTLELAHFYFLVDIVVVVSEALAFFLLGSPPQGAEQMVFVVEEVMMLSYLTFRL
jgi:hypothetical protein